MSNARFVIYHNPRCRKSRETLKLIEESGNDFEIVEYLKTPPTEDELRDIVTKLGLPVEYLVRKGESLFTEEFKGKDLLDEDWYKILAENPEIKQGLEAAKAEDPQLDESAYRQLDFIYERSAHREAEYLRYPIFRLME